MKINQLLMAQHREAEKLFEALEEAKPEERSELATTLARKLELHMQLEEEIVYPAICRLVEDSDEDVSEAEAEHELARQGIKDLLAMDEDAPGIDAMIEMLKAGVLHHVEEEEEEVLPKLAEAASDEQLEELAAQCEAHLLAAGEEPPSIDPDATTRDQLYAEARKAGIEGRSDMTKDELAAALDQT
jgi:iron-sulfur cluster repair protein YtfE (RIC family)